MEKIATATHHIKHPLRGKQNSGLRAGRTLNRYNTGRHFQRRIDSFPHERRAASIDREQTPDSIYVIRTSIGQEVLPAEAVVASHKSLSGVERAFRSLKTVDLQLRRQRLAPILFDDDKPAAPAARKSIVAPARRSDSVMWKALTRTTSDGTRVHSFRTLLRDLATIVKNRIQPTDPQIAAFDLNNDDHVSDLVASLDISVSFDDLIE